jgi:glycosyltransferase involved in cell wall biosynthesis
VSGHHFVSVIIPTLERATLPLALAALDRQTRKPDEVITVVDRDRRGISWARNEGIRRSRGDLIAITDDDGIPPSDWLERLIAAIDGYDAAAAGGSYQETDPLLDEIRRLRPLPDVVTLDNVGYAGNGGTILFRRVWLDRCLAADGHVFDESILSGQDWELMWRLRRHGGTVVYVPVLTTHLRRVTSLGSHLRHQFHRGIGIGMLYRIQRRAGPGHAIQRSLIWGGVEGRAGARWPLAIWRKLIGPFNYRHFSRARFFWIHWLAEKAQAVGFSWGMLRR